MRKRPLSQAGAAAIAREVAAKAAAPLAKDPTVATALLKWVALQYLALQYLPCTMQLLALECSMGASLGIYTSFGVPKRASFGKQLRSSSTATDLD